MWSRGDVTQDREICFAADFVGLRSGAHEASNNNSNFWGNYNKPVIFSESGAHEVWGCDNFIETRRNIWQNMFYGIAGSFDWEIEQLREDMKDLSIYGRVKEFMDGVDLEGENWHSGIVREKNNGSLKYEQSYLDDCIREDEIADVVYLRSGDQDKAFGVITNRRANYYTLGEGECANGTTPLPAHSGNNVSATQASIYTDSLRIYEPVEAGTSNNRLRIRNMKLAKEYKIKYYSPYDLANSIKEETRWGPQLTLEFPDMDTLDIILFEAFRMGGSFKSMETDTTGMKKSTQTKREQEIDEITVYPNPNHGNFVVSIENSRKAEAIHISDNLGKRLNSRYKAQSENYYKGLKFKSGIYFVEVIYRDKVLRKKIVIN